MQAYVGYGGTFDPVHEGHLAVARAVRDGLGVDVALVPAADPPHKSGTHASALHRRRMLELATAGERGLYVDARELGRDGPSFTVDTLQALRGEMGPRVPLIWVIGADSLGQLPSWSRWRRLFELGHILAATRPGHVLGLDEVGDREAAVDLTSRLVPPRQLLQEPAGHLALLAVEPPRGESSTTVRHAITRGAPWKQHVPHAVAAYIDRHRLYAGSDAA